MTALFLLFQEEKLFKKKLFNGEYTALNHISIRI